MSDAKLNLNQRRGVMQLKEKLSAKFESDMKSFVGAGLKLDINWESLAMPEDFTQNNYEEYFTQVFWEPLKLAFSDIAVDDIGKDALKAGVKKIEICNINGWGADCVSFENGTLKIDHPLETNTSDVATRHEQILNLLSSNI